MKISKSRLEEYFRPGGPYPREFVSLTKTPEQDEVIKNFILRSVHNLPDKPDDPADSDRPAGGPGAPGSPATPLPGGNDTSAHGDATPAAPTGSPSTLALWWEWLHPGQARRNIIQRGPRETLFLGRAVMVLLFIGRFLEMPVDPLLLYAMGAGAIWGLMHLTGTYIANPDASQGDRIIVRHLISHEWRIVIRVSIGKMIGGAIWLGLAAAVTLGILVPLNQTTGIINHLIPAAVSLFVLVKGPFFAAEIHAKENASWLAQLEGAA